MLTFQDDPQMGAKNIGVKLTVSRRLLRGITGIRVRWLKASVSESPVPEGRAQDWQARCATDRQRRHRHPGHWAACGAFNYYAFGRGSQYCAMGSYPFFPANIRQFRSTTARTRLATPRPSISARMRTAHGSSTTTSSVWSCFERQHGLPGPAEQSWAHGGAFLSLG